MLSTLLGHVTNPTNGRRLLFTSSLVVGVNALSGVAIFQFAVERQRMKIGISIFVILCSVLIEARFS